MDGQFLSFLNGTRKVLDINKMILEVSAEKAISENSIKKRILLNAKVHADKVFLDGDFIRKIDEEK